MNKACKSTNKTCKAWTRYIDDVFSLWDSNLDGIDGFEGGTCIEAKPLQQTGEVKQTLSRPGSVKSWTPNLRKMAN